MSSSVLNGDKVGLLGKQSIAVHKPKLIIQACRVSNNLQINSNDKPSSFISQNNTNQKNSYTCSFLHIALKKPFE